MVPVLTLKPRAWSSGPTFGKQGLADLVVIEQFAKLGDARRVRDRLTPQVNTNEAAQTGAVMQGFLARQVCQIEPVVDEMDAQHALQANGRPAITSLGEMTLDDFVQRGLWNDRLRHLKKLVTPRGLAVALNRLVCGHCQCLLLHLSTTFQTLWAWTLIIKALEHWSATCELLAFRFWRRIAHQRREP